MYRVRTLVEEEGWKRIDVFMDRVVTWIPLNIKILLFHIRTLHREMYHSQAQSAVVFLHSICATVS